MRAFFHGAGNDRQRRQRPTLRFVQAITRTISNTLFE